MSSNDRESVIDGLMRLAAIVITLGNPALAAKVAAEIAKRLRAEFEENHKDALKSWRDKKATFAAFVVKAVFAYLADLFLLHPLLVALALTMFSFSLIGMLASFITPILFIVAESAIAVKYERARLLEEKFGVKRHAHRWLVLGFVVAALPAAIVVALGFMSSAFIVKLGLVAFLGRQVLNIILAIVSFVMHVLLLFSGMTPREFIDSLFAAVGMQRANSLDGGAAATANRKKAALIQVAARYEHGRLNEQKQHGPIPPYPFPESVLELIRTELPDFGADGPKSDPSHGAVGPKAVPSPDGLPGPQRPLFPIN